MNAEEARQDPYTAVWAECWPCFQDVARRTAGARMRRYLHEFGYGNEDISGPIDQFWLTGPLRITPREQVAFIRRMLSGDLPAKKTNIEQCSRRHSRAGGCPAGDLRRSSSR